MLCFGYATITTNLGMRCVVWHLGQETSVNVRGDLQHEENRATNTNSGLYFELDSVAPAYDELVHPTGQPPQDPDAYDGLATDGIGNIVTNEPQNGYAVSSAPNVYDTLTNPNYYNVPNADNGMPSGAVCESLPNNDGRSSYLSPTEVAGASYFGLTSSTREVQPAPSAYDQPLSAKHDYYNVNDADDGAPSGI